MRYTTITNPANLEESLEEALGMIVSEAFLNRDDGETRFTQLISSAALNVHTRIYDDWLWDRHGEENSDKLREIIDMTKGLIAACLDRGADFPYEVVTLSQAIEIVSALANAAR